MEMIKPSRISFGGAAAIVTSMALIAGLNAAGVGKVSVISALLIAAVADNLTDSLSVHMYQESERLDQKEAFIGTISNFGTRLLICLSFVLIVAVFPVQAAVLWGLVWGMSLLAILSYILARHRRVSGLAEVGKHLGVAFTIILVSKIIGHWIATHVI